MLQRIQQNSRPNPNKDCQRGNQLLYDMMAEWSQDKDVNIVFDEGAIYIQQFKDGINLNQLEKDLAKDGIEVKFENFFCG